MKKTLNASPRVIGGEIWRRRIPVRVNVLKRQCRNHGIRYSLVEDDALVSGVLLEMLEKAGWIVTMTNDGAQGLDFLGAHAFDVVLVDVHMPRICGMQFVRRFSEIGGVSRPAMIVMSGISAEQIRQKFDGIPVDGVLSKPFSSCELMEVLQSALSVRK